MSNEKKNFIIENFKIFYKDIERKRGKVDNIEKMRIQTNLEFQQNEIKRLNKKYNIEMFSGNIRGGKAFAAEQKIRI